MHKAPLFLACLLVGAGALRFNSHEEENQASWPSWTSIFGGGAPRVLVFWAVDSTDSTKQLVKSGVEAFKKSGLRFDVALAHYDKGQDNWDADWYKENVKYSMNKEGWKLHLVRELFEQNFGSKWLNPAKDYDWVWIVDNDIDMGSTDIKKLFEHAKASDALVVAPSMIQVDQQGNWQEVQWKSTTPQENCKHHHVPLVEVTMPLFRADAWEKFMACKDCIGDVGDWGPDLMWCSYLGREVDGRDKKQACAVLDQVSVVHRNANSANDRYFPADRDQVQAAHEQDWNMGAAQGYDAYDCVQKDGSDGGVNLMKFGGMALHGLTKKPVFENGRSKEFARIQ